MKRLILILPLLLSPSTNAAHSCVGKVLNVDIGSPANLQVNIQGVGAGNILCSLNQSKRQFAAEGCKAIFSMLLAAKMSDKKIRLYFRNDTNTDCNKGNWQNLTDPAHQFYYMRLEG
jgi:hypothetical protein